MINGREKQKQELTASLAKRFASYGLNGYSKIAVGEAWTKIHEEEAEREKKYPPDEFRINLKRKALSKMIDEFRKQGKLEHYDDHPEVLEILYSNDDFEKRELTAIAIQDALAKLPAKQKEAITLHHLHGLKIEETARTMGCSSNTVKTDVREGMKKMYKILGYKKII